MRSIVYPHKLRALQSADKTSPASKLYRGRQDSAASPANAEISPASPDDYLARLAKHVPAESLAVLLLLAGQLQQHALGWRLSAVIFPALMAVTLDRDRRSRMPPQLRPRGLIYDLFVLLAYAAWALGTTDLARGLVGIDQAESSFIVLVVAFGLGWFDDRLGEQFEKKDDGSAPRSNRAGVTDRRAGPGHRTPTREPSKRQ